MVWFSSKSALRLLDMTKDEPTYCGVPSDVLKSSQHSHGQHFSKFVYNHIPDIQGLIFSSRFTETDCIALYDNRTIGQLSVDKSIRLNQPVLALELISKNIKVNP